MILQISSTERMDDYSGLFSYLSSRMPLQFGYDGRLVILVTI